MKIRNLVRRFNNKSPQKVTDKRQHFRGLLFFVFEYEQATKAKKQKKVASPDVRLITSTLLARLILSVFLFAHRRTFSRLLRLCDKTSGYYEQTTI